MNANPNDVDNYSEEKMPDDKEVFDKDEALKRLEGEEEFLKSLAEICIEEFPALLSKIKEAVDSHDSEALGKSAHELKGSVASFGKKAVFNTALELEMMGKENRLDDVEKTYGVLVKDIEHLENALSVFIKSK